MRHLTCDKEVEVIGANVLSVMENLNATETAPFMSKHGLENVQPDEWYPAYKWLNVMNDLAEHANLMQNLVAIGMKLAEKVVLPPEMADATLPDILMAWDHLYHHQHRGGEIGNHYIEKISDTEYRGTFTDIYPDDFKYGLAYGFAKRFLPVGANFKVAYEDMFNRMDVGGADTTVITIKWEA